MLPTLQQSLQVSAFSCGKWRYLQPTCAGICIWTSQCCHLASILGCLLLNSVLLKTEKRRFSAAPVTESKLLIFSELPQIASHQGHCHYRYLSLMLHNSFPIVPEVKSSIPVDQCHLWKLFLTNLKKWKCIKLKDWSTFVKFGYRVVAKQILNARCLKQRCSLAKNLPFWRFAWH